jgi:hypothetical protein
MATVSNPGSPTYPRDLQAQLGTVGILRLQAGHRASVTIHDLQTLPLSPACDMAAVRSH